MSTEGVNSTVLMCILLSVGSLEKAVTLSMESEGELYYFETLITINMYV